MITSLAAPPLGVPANAMPRFREEVKRRQQMFAGVIASVAAVLLILLGSLTVLGVTERSVRLREEATTLLRELPPPPYRTWDKRRAAQQTVLQALSKSQSGPVRFTIDLALEQFVENFAPGFARLYIEGPPSNTILKLAARNDFGLFVAATPGQLTFSYTQDGTPRGVPYAALETLKPDSIAAFAPSNLLAYIVSGGKISGGPQTNFVFRIPPAAVAVHPAHNWLAAALSNGHLQIVDLDRERPLDDIEVGCSCAAGDRIEYGEDGQLLAVTCAQTLRLFTVSAEGRLTTVAALPLTETKAFALHPHARAWAVARTDTRVSIYGYGDAITSSPLQWPVLGLAFSDGGDLTVVAHYGLYVLPFRQTDWFAASYEPIHTFGDSSSGVWRSRKSPPKLVWNSSKGQLALFDFEYGSIRLFDWPRVEEITRITLLFRALDCALPLCGGGSGQFPSKMVPGPELIRFAESAVSRSYAYRPGVKDPDRAE
jgi:hypothetical protein